MASRNWAVVVDSGLAKPLRQRHRADPEIGGDLFQGHTVGAAPGDLYDIVAELLRIGLGMRTSFQACPTGKPAQMSPLRAAVPWS